MSTETSAAILEPGTRVGPFEVLWPLHRGGQAVVYLGRLRQSTQMPVQKLLRRLNWRGATPDLIEQEKLCVLKIAEPEQGDHLINEWDYLPRVRHPHLIQTFSERFGDVTTDNRRRRQIDMAHVEIPQPDGPPIKVPYIALAYEPGCSLKQELEQRNHRPLSPACAVQIAIQMAEVLHHLHTHGRLVHHDISPSNILLRKPAGSFWPQPPDAILIDLAAADSLDNPRLRHIYGKRGYLPPERRRPKATISPQIDIYSLGMVLYEMLVGGSSNRPSTTVSSPGALSQFPPVAEQNKRVSPELNELVMQAIDPELERREYYLPSMGHLLDRLQRLPEAGQDCKLRGDWSLAASVPLLIPAVLILLLVVGVLVGGAYVFGEPGGVRPSDLTVAPTVTPVPTHTALPTATPLIQVPTSTAVSGTGGTPNLSKVPTSTAAPTLTATPVSPEARSTVVTNPAGSSFRSMTPVITVVPVAVTVADNGQ